MELVDDTGEVVISLLQDMIEPINTALSNGNDVEDAWLDSSLTELHIGHKIGERYKQLN